MSYPLHSPAKYVDPMFHMPNINSEFGTTKLIPDDGLVTMSNYPPKN